MTSNVTPLFSPSFYSYPKATFVANIGDEISLWNMHADGLRVYPDNTWGYWVDGSLREKIALANQDDPRVAAIERHVDTIELYAAMLGERLTDAT
jgi:hypothetical protein